MSSTALVAKFADRFSVDQSQVITTLKATAFKGQVSDAQMTALMIVADQYGLNPFCKEIYAFPDQNNGIVPVVGVDGWARIINENPNFDGMEFAQDEESCTCTIYRKDRSHPISATEYMSECKRPTKPWQSHPKRMLRHKAMIQCARLAFGYVGIFDQDEAERIVEVTERPKQNATEIAARAQQAEDVMDSEEKAKLLADLGAVADTGTEALEAAWKGLQKHQRSALKAELQGLKDRAAMVVGQ